jgi:hypothetical protein
MFDILAALVRERPVVLLIAERRVSQVEACARSMGVSRGDADCWAVGRA